MNQAEYATEVAPSTVWVTRSRPTDQPREGARLGPDEIRTGRAFLKVVAYPWGVEFEVCEGRKP